MLRFVRWLTVEKLGRVLIGLITYFQDINSVRCTTFIKIHDGIDVNCGAKLHGIKSESYHIR